jgi:hypothetical protein
LGVIPPGAAKPSSLAARPAPRVSRARELNNLFVAWKRACDLQDHDMMTIARRAIDAGVVGNTPREADMRAVENYFR